MSIRGSNSLLLICCTTAVIPALAFQAKSPSAEAEGSQKQTHTIRLEDIVEVLPGNYIAKSALPTDWGKWAAENWDTEHGMTKTEWRLTIENAQLARLLELRTAEIQGRITQWNKWVAENWDTEHGMTNAEYLLRQQVNALQLRIKGGAQRQCDAVAPPTTAGVPIRYDDNIKPEDWAILQTLLFKGVAHASPVQNIAPVAGGQTIAAFMVTGAPGKWADLCGYWTPTGRKLSNDQVFRLQ